MLDRAPGPANIPADVTPSSCWYCQVGQEAAPSEDGPDPARQAHLYLCGGLSTYAIGEITGLDRQRVTRMLRRAGVPLRPPASQVARARRLCFDRGTVSLGGGSR